MGDSLRIVLGREDRKRWDEYAALHGYPPTILGARVIRDAMRGEGAVPRFAGSGREDGRKTSISLRVQLKESERDALYKVMKAEGKNMAGFFAGLLRRYLASEPQYTHDETAALRESCRQIALVSSQLAQILCELRGKEDVPAGLLDAIESMMRAFSEHIKAVYAVLNPSRFRCRLKEV